MPFSVDLTGRPHLAGSHPEHVLGQHPVQETHRVATTDRQEAPPRQGDDTRPAPGRVIFARRIRNGLEFTLS
jgi:hypothetical protein